MNRKPYRAPWVLEIGEPKGNTPEAILAREEFHAQKISATLKQSVDAQLDAMMRGLWTDAGYWANHGMNPPRAVYPGLAAIRAAATI